MQTFEIPYTPYLNSNSSGFDERLISPNGQLIAGLASIFDATTENEVLSISDISINSSPSSFCSDLFSCPITYDPCCWQVDSKAVFYTFYKRTPRFRHTVGAPFQTDSLNLPVLKIRLP